MAGLLTFLGLLYLPDPWSVALYKQTHNEDYSCRYSPGLSPDSLASNGYSHQISICVCKDTTYFCKRKKKRVKSGERGIFAMADFVDASPKSYFNMNVGIIAYAIELRLFVFAALTLPPSNPISHLSPL